MLLAAAATTVRTRSHSRTPKELAEELAAAIERARGELDGAAAEAVWRRGAQLSFDQAVQAGEPIAPGGPVATPEALLCMLPQKLEGIDAVLVRREAVIDRLRALATSQNVR